MTVATFLQPNFTTQTATEYKTAIDGGFAVVSNTAGKYAPHQVATPNMTVQVDAGSLFVAGAIVSNAQQTTGTITAPVSLPRIDRVVIDAATGVVSVITGTPAGSPTAPAITAGKLPVAQVRVETTSTVITNSMITDERTFVMIPVDVNNINGNVDISGSLVWGSGVASFGQIAKRKTADETVTSSTTLQDDDHLTFAIGANEEWIVDFYLTTGFLLSTTGINLSINVPSAATINHNFMFISSSVSAANVNASNFVSITTNATIFFTPANLTGATDAFFHVNLWVLNGATPGNVILQWCQNVSSVTALRILKGSHLRAIRVA